MCPFSRSFEARSHGPTQLSKPNPKLTSRSKPKSKPKPRSKSKPGFKSSLTPRQPCRKLSLLAGLALLLGLSACSSSAGQSAQSVHGAPTQSVQLPGDPIQDFFFRLPLDVNLTLAPPIQSYSELQGPLQATQLRDASQLFPVSVAGVIRPQTLADLQAAVALARRENKEISLSGARHSMGGQTARQNALHLDMTAYDKMEYLPESQTLKVQSGATWKQIQRVLGEHGRAIGVMQDSNIFTVGGSLSLNVHGKDPRFGALIGQVLSFELLDAQGRLWQCSREENPEIFRAAIGGMGLLGIITEVHLKTEPNADYAYRVENISAEQLIERMEFQSQRPEVELLEAQMSIDHYNLLQEAQVYHFERQADIPKQSDDVSGEQSIWLRKMIYQFSRKADIGKRFRWWLQKELGPRLDAPFVSRNTAMAAPYRLLTLDPKEYTTDILQELFIPKDRVPEFLRAYRALIKKHQIALQNVTVRKQIQDTEALVSYAQSDMYAFVSYYQVVKNDRGAAHMQGFTEELVEWLLQHQGTFYLAYWPYGTESRLRVMYPALDELFALKRRLDPEGRFSNEWYVRFQAASR